MKAIVTIIGEDKVGIIARTSSVLSEANVNILDINQTVMREYFTMIMLVDIQKMNVSIDKLNEQLNEAGKDLGLSIRVQREDIFKKMHEI
ncbi:MAG: ACT domain-containing protein [Tissierellales bacterium]|nr:ACT domain-containing protein [Tissierellales bacterium]MBN2826726.1 ACT domain-containing protein [Tissierellales bacterium]